MTALLVTLFFFHRNRCVMGDGIQGPKGMVWVPGGEKILGNENPTKVQVEGFWMDQSDVTNDQFAAFVKATGYVTTAEQKTAPAGTPKPASWHHPEGPQSNIIGKGDYPVVQVSDQDALAYAKWAGKRLPTNAEWVFAKQESCTGNSLHADNTFRLVMTPQMFETFKKNNNDPTLAPPAVLAHK